MDRDTNYVVVGAFVLLVIAMAASFVFWYTDQQDKRTYQRYEVYFRGNVSGLTAGSPVRYLGVDVGKVARVMLEPGHRNRVEVIVDIESAAPIDGHTLANLKIQGITGLLYIDMEEDPKAKVPDALAQGHRYPVIRSAPSDLDAFLSSLPVLATRATELVDRFNQVLSDDNVRAVKETVDNLRRASERLPDTVRDAQLLVADMRRASHEVEAVAADLHKVTSTPDVEVVLGNIRRATEKLADTSDHLDEFVAENTPGLSRFTKQSLPEFEQLLRESRQAARDFSDLSRSLKQNPSQLFYESNYRGVELPK
jgi:phospholipid/cholesterol/gamma-HCH transport system substrate-binding protein